jgi:uncharacterized membrane protein
MGWFIAGFVLLRVLVIAFLVLLVTRIVGGSRRRHDEASEVLRRRFAAGEITEEQFNRLREVLDS